MRRRSGNLYASNDVFIEALLADPLYDIRDDGTIWTLVCRTGKVSTKGVWREAGRFRGEYREISYHGHRLKVHRIIYRKFVGPMSADLVINHIDGFGANNRPDNLELISQHHNSLHYTESVRRQNTEPFI